MPTKFLQVWLLALLCVAACADTPVSPAAETEVAQASASLLESASEIGANATPVVGGKESHPCAWPSTVDVAGCTATLIHPRVVTTAAHCLSRTTARVTFTAGEGQPGSFSLMAECTSGARGGRGGVGPRDWAYCVLPEDERVKKIPYTPPLVGCEAEKYLKAGGTAWVVGFGATSGNANDYGVKREVEVKINKVENGIIDIGDRDAGACYGDSGGPLYIKISDGTHDWGWRVAGSTSGAGGPCNCTCSTVYADIRSHVKAIEENEDIDVTPCTDADGNWAPGPQCTKFITDPASGTGTYPDCSVQYTSEPIASCGAPADSSGAAGAAGGGAAGAAAGAGAGAAGDAAQAGAAGVAGAVGSAAAGSSATAAAGSGGAAAGTAGTFAPSESAAAAGARAPVTVAGATAPGLQSAGATGSITNATASAGTIAAQPAPEQDSGGCHAARVGADRSRAWGLLSALLFALAAHRMRGRRRQR